MIPRTVRAQTLVETALIMPLLVMVITGIIVLGIGLFYQQQVTNAAREAARYASLHSATSQCPSVSWLDPMGAQRPLSYNRCDGPETGWSLMVAHARTRLFGLDPSSVHFAACWSGYWEYSGGSPKQGGHDALLYIQPDPSSSPTPNDVQYLECTIGGTDPEALTSCPPPATIPSASDPPFPDGDDKASSLADAAHNNHVTVYACHLWVPPLAGFLLLPDSVTLRATVTEALQRQQ